MSYCDSNARTGLDWRRTSSTRFGADFAAQIGRCSRSNSTEPASARRLSVDKTAYGADRTYHSPIREGLWRSVAVRELSITQGDRCRKALQQPQSSQLNETSWRRGRRRAIGTVSALFSHIVTSESQGIRSEDQHCLAQFFRRWLFAIGFSNGHSSQVGEKQQGCMNCWRLRGLAGRWALNYYRSWL